MKPTDSTIVKLQLWNSENNNTSTIKIHGLRMIKRSYPDGQSQSSTQKNSQTLTVF